MTHGNCRFYFSISRPKPPTKRNFTLFLIHRLRLCYHLPTQKCVFIILIGFVVSTIKRLCSRKQHTRLPYNIFSRKNSFIVCDLDKYEQIVCVCTVLRIKQKKTTKWYYNNTLPMNRNDDFSKRALVCGCLLLIRFQRDPTACVDVCADRFVTNAKCKHKRTNWNSSFLYVNHIFFFSSLQFFFLSFLNGIMNRTRYKSCLWT